MSRWYYRCTDCLTIMAADQLIHFVLRCGACDGQIEVLGQVRGKRLAWMSQEVPCDGRCTNAQGPSCDCSCRGANHGSGMLVEVVRDGGAAPRLLPRTPEIEAAGRARAEEYRTARQILISAIDARHPGAREDLRAGLWVDRTAYDAVASLYLALERARGIRTHRKRLEVLRSAKDKLAPPTRARQIAGAE